MGAGGAERVMAAICNHFSKKGDTIHLLTFDDGRLPSFYELSPAVQRLSLDLLKSSSSWRDGVWNNMRRVRMLRRALVQTKPDVVISFLVSVNVLTIFALLFTGLPIIVSERDDPWKSEENKFWIWARRLIYPFADKIVVHTPHSKKFFPRIFWRKIFSIPNPLMVPPQLQPKQNYALTGKIISIGRLTKQKGFDILMEAFSYIGKTFPKTRLQILGEGPERNSLEELAVTLKIRDQVDFDGVVKDVYQPLRDADLFVLASRYEGFGNVLCEAMAVGTPIIAAEASGPKEILQDKQDSFLVPIESAPVLAEAMTTLLNDQKQREALGRQARQNVGSKFGFEKIMDRWEDLFKQTTQSN